MMRSTWSGDDDTTSDDQHPGYPVPVKVRSGPILVTGLFQAPSKRVAQTPVVDMFDSLTGHCQFILVGQAT